MRASGRRYAFLDKLLAATARRGPRRSARSRCCPRLAVPPGASIVAVTPLHDLRMVSALVDLRRRGSAVAAVRVDVADLLPARADAGRAAATRLWLLELERARRRPRRRRRPGRDVATGRADAATVLETLRLASGAHRCFGGTGA